MTGCDTNNKTCCNQEDAQACDDKNCCKMMSLIFKSQFFFQSLLLLALRLYFGWQFFLAGKGKFANFDRTVGFFEKIKIPFPELNVYLAAGTEMIGGLLLLFGLASRLISFPLAFTMCIAYLTAHNTELMNIFSEPDKFLSASPFLYLLTTLIVILFGPGMFSLDALAKKFICKKKCCK